MGRARGLDERFALPGGGLVNHDLYRRACAPGGAELIVMLDEGRSTSTTAVRAPRRYSWDEMAAEYLAITGSAHRPPATAPLYVGRVHPAPPSSSARPARRSGDWRPMGPDG